MEIKNSKQFSKESRIIYYQGNALDFLCQLPDGMIQLVMTSPPIIHGKYIHCFSMAS
jgi:DNA modification methylase